MDLKIATKYTTHYPTGFFYCDNSLSCIFSCKETALKSLRKYKTLYFFIPVVREDLVSVYLDRVQNIFSECQVEKTEHSVQNFGLTYFCYKLSAPKYTDAVYDVLLFYIKYCFSVERQLSQSLSAGSVPINLPYYNKYSRDTTSVYGYRTMVLNIREIIQKKRELPISVSGLFKEIQGQFTQKNGPIYRLITEYARDVTLVLEDKFWEKSPDIVDYLLTNWAFSPIVSDWILSGKKIKIGKAEELSRLVGECQYEFKDTATL